MLDAHLISYLEKSSKVKQTQYPSTDVIVLLRFGTSDVVIADLM